MAGPSGGTAPLAFGTNDIQTVKVWAKRVEREVLPRTLFGKFLKTGVAMYKDELTKGPGDLVKFPFETLIDGDGAIQNEILSLPTQGAGAEQAPTYFQDSLTINQQRFAVRWYGRIDRQRVVMDVRRTARDQLITQWANKKDFAFLYHIVGDDWLYELDVTDSTTASADGLPESLRKTGLNRIRAATTNNHIVTHLDETLTLDHIEEMITRAKTMKDEYGQPVFRPVMVEGEEIFPIIMHTYHWRDLRRNTNVGQWLDIQKAAMQGGLISRNPIFTGAGGVYGSAVFFESTRMGLIGTALADGTTEPKHRALCLLGKGAVCYANGREGGRDEKYLWDEDSYDLRNEHVVGSSQIWGMVKTQFGATGAEYDYAVIRTDTFASADMSEAPALP